MKHIRTIYALVTAVAMMPLLAFAQYPGFNNPNAFSFPRFDATGSGFGGGFGGGGGYAYQTRGGRLGDIESLIMLAQTLLGYVQIFVFVVALFFFLFAAFKFVKGDAAGGGKMLLNAVYGIVIAILAFSIIPLVCFITQAGGRACGL